MRSRQRPNFKWLDRFQQHEGNFLPSFGLIRVTFGPLVDRHRGPPDFEHFWMTDLKSSATGHVQSKGPKRLGSDKINDRAKCHHGLVPFTEGVFYRGGIVAGLSQIRSSRFRCESIRPTRLARRSRVRLSLTVLPDASAFGSVCCSASLLSRASPATTIRQPLSEDRDSTCLMT